MEIDTKSFNTNEALCYSLPQPIYLLFNPWCKGDHLVMRFVIPPAAANQQEKGLINYSLFCLCLPSTLPYR